MEDPETVCKAIATLYGKDQAAAAEANIWLDHFQKSVSAWEVCDKLLEARTDGVSSYFAAQTLRTKVQVDLNQLPRDAQPGLRDTLLGHLAAYGAAGKSEDARVILTQLSVALADLYLQNFTWNNFIPEILQRLNKAGTWSGVVLGVLKVFPEETESGKLRLGRNRRDAVAQELAAHTNDLLTFLAQVWEKEAPSSPELLHRVLSCLGAWLLNPHLPSELVAMSPLLPALFQLLGADNVESRLQDAAADCVCQALMLCEDVEKHKALAEKLFQGVHSLQPAFHMAVAREDSELVESLGRVVTELCETLVSAMVENRDGVVGSLASLDFLLIVIGYHDYAVVEMTFNFWYRISEFLFQRNDEQRNEAFRPYIERLLMALLRHSRLESDHKGTPDEAEEVADFRDKVTECVKDVTFLVGSTNIVRTVLTMLQEKGAESSWEETEAALHIVSAVARLICPDEEEVVPALVGAILGLPASAHVAVRFTATRVLSQLWEWLHAHGHHLAQAVTWLLANAGEAKLQRITVQTLEILACSGSPATAASLAPFLPAFSDALVAIDAQQPRAPEDTLLSMLRASSMVISSLPGEEAAIHLNTICSAQAQSLSVAMEEENSDQDQSGASRTRGRRPEPIKWLDRLSAILRQLTPPPPAAFPGAPTAKPAWSGTVHALWPVLGKCLSAYAASQRTVEHACKSIRFAVRSLGVDSFDFLPALVNQMVEIYNKYPHSCILYLGSILVDEYGAFPEVGPGLLAMMEALTVTTFKLLQDEHGFRDHPDTIDDLFRLCNRFVQRAPYPFFDCGSARKIMQTAIEGLKLDHYDAHLSVVKFICKSCEFVAFARKEKGPGTEAEKVMVEAGPALVLASLQAAAFHLTRPQIRNLPDVLFALLRLDKNGFAEWLGAALKDGKSFGDFGVTPQQLASFHSHLLQVSESKAMLPALKDFIQLFR